VLYAAVLDANVLHPISLCDLLLRLAEAGFYRPLWSRQILDETTSSILRRHPGASQEALARRVRYMEAAFPDAMVIGHDTLAATLPELGTDAHVLAAAVVGGAAVIVTQNLKHFPAEVLDRHHLEAQSADEFLVHQWWLDPAAAARVIAHQSEGTRRPHYSIPELLGHLRRTVPGFADLAAASTEVGRLL
jgi:hypothetical protein